MIQRIQTIFLVLVAALMATMLFMPLAELNNETSSYLQDAMGVMTIAEDARMVFPTWPVFVVLILSALSPLEAIFFYKKRVLQIMLCKFNAFIILGFYLAFFFYWNLARVELSVTTTFQYTLVMPIAALILNYMAIKRIRADENLVRSADRIR